MTPFDDRQTRIAQLVKAHLRGALDGTDADEHQLIAAHGDLLPELEQELRKARLVRAAYAEAAAANLPNQVGETSVDDKSTRPGTLRIRCPHCHGFNELDADDSLENLSCSGCRCQFSVLGELDNLVSQPRYVAHFLLLERLGGGGFGTVWKARDTKLDRLVAVKLPHRSRLGAEESALFFREARAAAQLHHPGIVGVFEVGRTDESIYIVSELIEGISLADWLKDGRLSAPEAAELCRELATALVHAHAHGVIHRDLKPANIILDANLRPHLADFGLARRELGEVTMTVDGQMVGTPAYMSPEQARGDAHECDARSDLYALGVILFELLTGALPFRGQSSLLVAQITRDEPPRPRQLRATVPCDLETITLKCLEKEPARRYGAAAELHDDLQRFLRGEPILARPVGRLARGWRWCKRNPMVASLAALLLTACVLGVAGIAWNWRQAELARQEAASRATENQRSLEHLKAASSLVDRGRTFLGWSHWDDAANCFSKAIELRPDYVPAWVWRAETYLQLGLWELGARDLQRHFSLQEPDDSAPWCFRAMVCAYLRDETQYRHVCSRMRERFAGSEAPMEMLDIVRSAVLLPNDVCDPAYLLQAAQQAVVGSPGDRVYLFVLGTAHFRCGQFPQAIQRCREALLVIRDWPRTAAIQSVLAMAHQGLGETTEAQQALQLAEQAMDQELEQMYEAGKHEWDINMGAIRFPYTEWLEAASYLREARSVMGLADNDDPRLSVMRARSFAGLRRLDEAAKEYVVAMQLNANIPQIRLEMQRNRGLQHVQRGEFKEAAAALEQAVALSPQDCDLWEHLAMSHLGSGNVDGYRRTCAAMIEQFGQTRDSRIAYRMMDVFATHPDSLADPKQLLPIAQVASTWKVSGQRMPGVAHYRLGNYEEAVTQFEEFATTNRPQPFDLLFLAMAHHRLGHQHDARKYFDEAEAWFDQAQRANQGTNDMDRSRLAWGSWRARIQLNCLREEARSLIIQLD